MTGAETAQLVQRINALWPGANLPAETAREWATLLTPVGFAAATAAVRRLAEEPGRQYAPRVWEIIFACKPKRRELAQPDMCDCGMRDCPCALVGRCERGWIISPNPPELPAGAVEKVGAVS